MNSTLQNFIGTVAKGVFDMSSLLSKVDELRTLQQHVRSDVLQGNQDTANHIDREAHDIREDTAQHHQQTQGVVRTGVNELKQFHVSAADLDRFKASLKFNGMDYRYNDVKGAHRETFEWVFPKDIVPTVPVVTSDDNSSDSGQSSMQSSMRSSLSGRSSASKNEPRYIREARLETFDDFGQWLASDSKLYWISGKPGAGKSTLMKFICQRMRTASRQATGSIVLRHFFWYGAAASSPMQRSIAGMLSTLLYYLLLEDEDLFRRLMDAMREAHLEHKDSPSDWDRVELQRCLHEALGIYTKNHSGHTIYIFIDGLDEVSEFESDETGELLGSIYRLQDLPAVRLCVSSRPEARFQDDISRSRHLRLERLTVPDIDRFVLDTLQPYAQRFPEDPGDETLEWFVEELVTKSEGVFLWARLAAKRLVRGLRVKNSIAQLKEHLELMPSDLNDLFASMWKRLGDDEQLYRTHAANMFRLLLCNHEEHVTLICLYNNLHSSLDLDALTLHLALNLETSDLVLQDVNSPNETPQVFDRDMLRKGQETLEMVNSCCAGLVEINQPTSRIPTLRFVHRTASEFLTDSAEGCRILESHSLGEEAPRLRLLIACIARAALLRQPGHDIDTKARLDERPALCTWDLHINGVFLLCPSIHRERIRWGRTLGMLSNNEVDRILQSLQIVYFRLCGDPTNPRFAGWIRQDFGYPFIHLAASWGFSHYVKKWKLQEGHDVKKAVDDYLSRAFIHTIVKYIHVCIFEDENLSTEKVDFYSALVATDQTHYQPAIYPMWWDMNYWQLPARWQSVKLCTPFDAVLDNIGITGWAHGRDESIRYWNDQSYSRKVLEILKLFVSSCTIQHQRVVGAYWPHGPRLQGYGYIRNLPWNNDFFGKKVDKPSAQTTEAKFPVILVKTSALWAIQFQARKHWAEHGPSILGTGLLELVKTMSGDSPLPLPRALLLLRITVQESHKTEGSTAVDEVMKVPRDLQTKILEPLTKSLHMDGVDQATTDTWAVAGEEIRIRFEDSWEHERNEFGERAVMQTEETTEFLAAQGLIASRQTAWAMYEACGVAVPQWVADGTFDNFWKARRRRMRNDRTWVAPPPGAPSSEQEFARNSMMPVVT